MTKHKKTKPRGRPKTVNRDGSIELAMMDYWRDGVLTKSLNEVCRQIGISKPAFYREFESEDGLMAEVLGQYRLLNIVPLLNLIESDRPFAEVLNDAINWLSESREKPNGCLFVKMRLARSQLGPITLKRVQSMEMELLKKFEAWYRRGLAQNEVDVSIAPQFASTYIGTQFTLVSVQMGIGMPVKLVKDQASLALSVLLH